MRAERVTIKRATLWKLKDLLAVGDSVAALEIVDQLLDTARTLELQRCKDLVYRSFKAGEIDHETFRRRWDMIDQNLW